MLAILAAMFGGPEVRLKSERAETEEPDDSDSEAKREHEGDADDEA